MKRLMGKLGREHALFGDVAFGNYEIQRLAGLVTGGGLRDFSDDRATVAVEVALHVSRLANLTVEET